MKIKCTECEHYDATHTYINRLKGTKTKGGCSRNKGCVYVPEKEKTE